MAQVFTDNAIGLVLVLCLIAGHGDEEYGSPDGSKLNVLRDEWLSLFAGVTHSVLL